MPRDDSTGVAIQRIDQNVDLKVSSLWFRSQSKNMSISCYVSKFCSRYSAQALVLSVMSRIIEICHGKASTTLSPYFGWSVTYTGQWDGCLPVLFSSEDWRRLKGPEKFLLNLSQSLAPQYQHALGGSAFAAGARRQNRCKTHSKNRIWGVYSSLGAHTAIIF